MTFRCSLRIGLAVTLLALAVSPGLARAAAAGKPRLSDERVLLRTNRGDLVLALYPEVAPRHVAQILKLVRLGAYDTTPFHRVEPNFVVQLSRVQDRKLPLTPEQRAAIVKLPAELSKLVHRAGVVSMARDDDDVDSAETSFSLLLHPAPHLDGKYTIFGELERGAEVLAAVAAEPRDAKNAPRAPFFVERALVVSTAALEKMRAGGELRGVIAGAAQAAGPAAAPASAAIPTGRSDRQMPGPAPLLEDDDEPAPANDAAAGAGPPVFRIAGLAIITMVSVLGVALSARWPKRRLRGLALVAALAGAALLLAEWFAR